MDRPGCWIRKKQFYGSLLLFLCLHALNVVPLHLSLDSFLGALLMELFFQVGYSLHCVLYLMIVEPAMSNGCGLLMYTIILILGYVIL